MKAALMILLLVLCSTQVDAGTFKAGFSVRDVTPRAEDMEEGIRIGGWSAAGPAKTVQEGDSLRVRAMAMRDKENTLLVILSADILKFHPGDGYMLREWFGRTFNADPWHLIMNPSHTHQSPENYLFSRRPYAKVHNTLLLDAVKAAIAEAVDNAVTPMKLRFANLHIREDMVFNKNQRLADRDPRFGAVDTDLPVFVFMHAEAETIAGFLWSVAAHPTYLGAGGLRSRNDNGPPVSSHAPGAVARALKETYGQDVVCMFAQGAGGDLKMQFPELLGRIRRSRCADEETETSGAVHGNVWTEGEREGELLTQEQYIEAMNNYARLYVDIVKQGFAEGTFADVENLRLRVAGKEIKLPVATEKPPAKTTLGQINRTWWARPEGTVAEYQKVIEDANAPYEDRIRAYEQIYRIYDDQYAAYSLFVSTVVFNDRLRIVTMSNEVCYEIGKAVKEHYRERGIEAVFFGYTPFGSPYYPSNLQRQVGTYQGAWMHPEDENFDFDAFALKHITELMP